LTEQAQELVRNGNFHSYEIRYPDSEWEPYNRPVYLLSLEELDTLPGSILARIERLYMAGDMIFNPEFYHVEEDFSGEEPAWFICKNDEEGTEQMPVEYGTQLTDIGVLKPLTGLKELCLWDQPLKDLEGIQYLESLEELSFEDCRELTDASAAFTLQTLKRLWLRYTPLTSLEGIQNLYDLEELNLDGTEIEDLSPTESLKKLNR
jgi:hypothetical protein